MSSEVASYQRPVSLQFGNSETSGASQSFAGYVAGSVQFHSSPDRLDTLPHAEGASFDSGELEHERLCLPGTRTKILELIEQWIVDPQGERIFWLNGMAGTGKSTIARTLAHSLSERKQLGASFFFSRGRGDRGNVSKFFTSIAYQLAFWDTENRTLASFIRAAFDQHPDIMKRAKRDQWRYLIQEPLSQMGRHSPRGVVLILVIDALDECEDDRDVQLILKILSEAKSFNNIQFRVFMTGRPSLSVRDAFLERVYQSLILHEIERYVVQQDLRIFFEYELRSIQKRRRLIGDFPSKGDVENLVQRAGELFIYAATICRFIGERKHPPPRERLKLILQNNPSTVSALKNLDQLYIQILREAVPETDSVQDKRVFCSHFRVVVGAVVSLFSSLSVSSLAALLFVELDSIHLTLDSLLSILNIPQKNNVTISLIHPSFRDFLLDQTRCTELDFWIDSAETHVALTKTCLNLMAARLKRDICDLRLPGTLRKEIDPGRVRDHIPSELDYACTYWIRHLESSLQAQSSILEHSLLDRVREFLEHNILYWLEALSLLGKMQESILMLSTLLIISQSHDNGHVVNLVHDAYRFSLEHRFIIEQAPLQTYLSALMFSPSTSILRKLFKSQIPAWVHYVSEVPNSWGSLLQTLEGHTRSVRAVTFSPDGRKLASASYDSVRIWDTATGTPLQTLQGHRDFEAGLRETLMFSLDGQIIAFLSGIPDTVQVWDVVFGSLLQTFEAEPRPIRSIALSPDGQEILFGYRDGMITVRDTTFGTLLKTLKGHAYITSVNFSPNGQKLASTSEHGNGAICVWDVASGAQLQTIGGDFTSVMFSPDGQKLASGSTNGTVHIWEAESGSLLQTLRDQRNEITWITFLCNGQNLASGSDDSTVRVWNTTSGLLLQTCEGHGYGTSVSLSPDGQKLASGCKDRTVRIASAAFGSSVQLLKGHHDCIMSMTFSPNGEKLASVSEGAGQLRTICIWDMATGSPLELGRATYPKSITFSPDGEKLAYISNNASGGHSVYLWDAAWGLKKLEFASRFLTLLHFSPDGQKLRSVTNDAIVHVWNAVSGSPLEPVEDDHDGVRSSAIPTANQPEELSMFGRWVTVNRKRIIWLPPARQASEFVTHGTKIAIGSTSGVVTILHLDFKQMGPYLTSPSVSPKTKVNQL